MKVKKFLALALAGVMTLSMGMVAFAAEEDPNKGKTEGFQDESQIQIPKVYKLVNSGTSNPEESFKFKITPYSVSDSKLTKDNMPGFKSSEFEIKYIDGEATEAGDRNTATLDLPDFPSVGVYTYKITEEEGNTAGVGYDSKAIYLKITVVEENGLKRIAAMHYETEDGEKLDDTDLGFNNTYSAAKQISISKIVTGNMGDKSKYFDVVVTVTNPDDKSAPGTYTVDGGSYEDNPKTIKAGVETTFKIKDEETINIKNVPYGVTYTVVEADYTSESYEASYKGSDINSKDDCGTVDEKEESVEITNKKASTIDTGISLDNLPYILLLCLVAFGAAALFFKKRNALDR